MSTQQDSVRGSTTGFWHPIMSRLIAALIAGASSLFFLQSSSVIELASQLSPSYPELVIVVSLTTCGFAFPVVTAFVFFGTLALLALAMFIA